MASTVVSVQLPYTGLTSHTLSLYAFPAGTSLLNSGGADALTELSGNLGTYTATVTEAVAGTVCFVVLDGSSNFVANGVVPNIVDDTGTYPCAVAGLTAGDVIRLSGSSTAADNAEVVYDTDFATNYDGTNDTWVVRIAGTLQLLDSLNNVSQANITGGAYALDTDANGRIRIVDGTGVGEINTASGAVVQVDQLGTQAKADVNAEALDVLNTDTFAEPGQETPGATITLAAKIGYLYKALRNKVTQTATTYSLYNDDTTTVDHKATVSDDGTTFTRTELTTGP